jgi:hypothetical protein
LVWERIVPLEDDHMPNIFIQSIKQSAWLFVVFLAIRLGAPAVAGLIWKDYWSGAMSPFSWPDRWVVDSWSPFLTSILAGGLFAIWFIIAPAEALIRNIRGATQRAFFQAFNLPENARCRHNFRLVLWAAYKKHNQNAEAHQLPALIEGIEWPSDFPPDNDIFEYAQNINWPNEQGKQFWSFCERLFRPIFDNSQSDLLTDDQFNQLIEARRTIAKFWDEWAHQIENRLIRLREVRAAIEGNKNDLKALAIAEIHSSRPGWDRSSGKTLLFKLAKHHSSFGPKSWIAKTKILIASKIHAVGNRIENDV